MTTITLKERQLLKAIAQGMDEPGRGWLHELAPVTRETAGVLGSLVKKGLVRSEPDSDQGPEASWVEITTEGKAAIEALPAPIGKIPGLVEAIESADMATSMISGQQAKYLRQIDRRLNWADLASTERTMLRFAYEAVHRVECPYPLRP